MKIKAAVIAEKGQPFQITELELAPPKQNEVLVKVAACGVCHTDEEARKQNMPVPLPAVFGHEGCGVVEEVGPGVTGFKKGDRVGFSYGYCGVCEACRTGQPYGCEEFVQLNFKGTYLDGTKRLRDGDKDVSVFFGQSAFASHAVVSVNNLIPVPDSVELTLAAPLGCGIQTGSGAVMNYLKPNPASSIIITGCGTVGLSAVMAAKIFGCTTIIACDIIESRLELAKELGATHTINAKNVPDVVAEVKEITRIGTNYAIDCTGSGVCVRQSLNCTRPLGTCIVLGATAELTIHVEFELMGQAKKLIGIVEGCSVPQVFIPKLLEYYGKGMFPFDRLITFYKFSEINQAFQDALEGKVIKAVLVMD
ncbi:MAG: NAD(P)-dependent alcohol dehydrogenase [Firmicutes bacterium]|nr:NAD(P)-dependent alcohol dehydrogenase [Bacillota bacterium]